jgi:GT2 family glycosyltransferase
LAGYRIVNEPAARVYHKVSLSQVHNSAGFVYHGQRNVSATFLKNMPAALLARYGPLHLAYALGSFAYFARIGRVDAFLRAKRDLVRQLPSIRRKRQAVQSLRTATPAEIGAALDRRWLPAKLGKFAGAGRDAP